jgi:hypothetical protein
MIKKVFLSVIILFLFSVRSSCQISGIDTIKIYEEIAGNYEYYSDLQFFYFSLYVENKSLLFNDHLDPVQSATPHNLVNLEFKTSDSAKKQFLYFNRNINDEISSCRLIKNGSVNLANKQLEEDTIPIADKKYSAEALRDDLTLIKKFCSK